MRQLSPVFALSLHIGCVTSTVTSVRVRDPSEVSLQPRGAPARTEIIPAGAGTRTAVAETGTYWDWFTKKPFEILAIRESSGALRLQCDSCASANWPLGSHQQAALVAADGRIMPTIERVSVTSAALIMPYDLCFVRAPKGFCRVESRDELVIPWGNVVDARRVQGPVRFWGTFMIGLGSFGALGGALLLSPVFGDASQHFTERAALAIPMIAMATTALAVGLWQLLSPAREEVMVPLGQATAAQESRR
ncbi:MAG TPA: hypothetical protein VKN99_05000 [Polyangia bacterium]|nr:hypothetical protein [Polyangia bacterium]